MHISAKCGIGIAYRLSICLSVRDAGRSTPHKLESLEANCTDNYANTFALRSSKAIRLLSVMGTSGNFWETRGRVGKMAFWTLEHKSRIISETLKDRGKVTMDGL